MIIRMTLAGRGEPYWWLEDNAGFRHAMPLAITRTTRKPDNAVIWAVIVGPVLLRFGFTATTLQKATCKERAGE